jgi:DNA transformation protein
MEYSVGEVRTPLYGTFRNRGDVFGARSRDDQADVRGKGGYYKGNIIAVEFRGDILLKADGVTAPAFEAAGAMRWAYEGRTGKEVNMPYWSIPADAFDDPDMMARWVKLAHEAALRSGKVNKGKPKRNID